MLLVLPVEKENGWHLFFIERATQMPYYLSLERAGIQQFEDDIQHFARLLQMTEVNVFEITFTIKIARNRDGAYVPACEDFKVLSEQEKKEFGELYLDFLSRRENAFSNSAQ